MKCSSLARHSWENLCGERDPGSSQFSRVSLIFQVSVYFSNFALLQQPWLFVKFSCAVLIKFAEGKGVRCKLLFEDIKGSISIRLWNREQLTTSLAAASPLYTRSLFALLPDPTKTCNAVWVVSVREEVFNYELLPSLRSLRTLARVRTIFNIANKEKKKTLCKRQSDKRRHSRAH